MKTKVIFLISVLVVLVILVTSCTKDPLDSVDPDVYLTYIKPTIVEFSISPEDIILPYGEEVIISWEVYDARKTMLNDSLVESSGTQTIKLFESTVYEIIALNGDSTSTLKKNILVGDWKTSSFGLLSYEKPWSISALKYVREGEVISNSILIEDQTNDLYYFSKDGKVYFDTDSQGELSRHPNDIWYLIDKNHLFMTGEVFEIVKLTEDELIIQKDTEDQEGNPVKFRIEYRRK